MLTALRGEITALFAGLPLRRKPALRRSTLPDYLLATDLPQTCEEDICAQFIHQAENLGWQVNSISGWLWLDKLLSPPDAAPAAARGELGCLISLLERHPGGNPTAEEVRLAIKAVELPILQREKLFSQWHRAWAMRLRQGLPLPGKLLPWLYMIAHQTRKEESP